MELKCLIVDDEPLALDLLENYVNRTPFLHLMKRCGSGVEVLDFLNENKADVIFMDIQMPELNGLELSRLIDNRTKVIFVTAFEKFALDGFRVDALDYLLKPVSYPDFLHSAQKALQWFEMAKTPSPASSDNSIFVKSEYKLLKVDLNHVLYFEGLKDYIKIYLDNAMQPILSLMSMKSLEEMLPMAEFIRVHRSFIVRKDKIQIVERNRIVFGKEYIPVSDSYKARFTEFLESKIVS